MPELETLAAPSDEIRRRLSSLFTGMMKSLFNEKGSRFRVELVADPAVQRFVGAHASVLDSTFEKVGMSDAMRRRLTRSNYIFSGMKAFHELHEAFPSLLDENGNRKSFERFLNDVQSIDRTYNVNYLRAEYNFVAASAEMAARWEQFMADGDRYNLQYRTQADDKVRPEHAALDRVTLPPSDSFWEQFYPPNGWNCFVGHTPVLTSEGWKFIKDIREGDLVVGGSGEYRKVIATLSRPVNAELVRVFTKGALATCTENHRFLTSRGWIAAADLKPFDILVQVGEISPMGKFVNAIHNSLTLLKYLAVSIGRKREPVAPEAVDGDTDGRQVEINDELPENLALLEWHSRCLKVMSESGLSSAFGLYDGTHPFWMKMSGLNRIGNRLCPAFSPVERGSRLKFLRNALYKGAVGLVLPLSHMFPGQGKRAVDTCKVTSGGSPASGVVDPLSPDGIGTVTDRDIEVHKDSADGAPVDMPVGGKPSETSLLDKVTRFGGIRCPATFNGFDSLYDFLRQTFLHTRYAFVRRKDNTSKSIVKVYNLSVQDDESYVVPSGIVHNCRCTVVQVRKSKYPVTPHDEAMRLGDEALQRDSKGIFRFNPGIERKSVPDYNPYTIRKCSTCPIAKGGSSGNLAAFIPDNEVCQTCVLIRSSQRCVNQELYDRLISNPDYRDVIIDENTGGVKGIHKGHIIHSSDKERTFFSEKLTSTDLELLCQDILFRKGHSCILENETQLDASGRQLPQLDTLTNGEYIDIRAITEKGQNTVRNALNSKKKQLRNFNTKTGADCHSVILYFHDPNMFDENQIKSQLGHTLRTVICVLKDGTIRKFTK